MNDTQVGSVFRAVRLRRGLTQSEVGAAAGLGRSTVSSIELGNVEQASLRTARAIARVLGISLTVDARWRGAEATRLLEERHGALVREVAAVLAGLGFEVRVEYTFNIWGERGSIDVLAWHPLLRAVVAIEVKTRLVDFQAIGSVLVLPEESWARHAVRRFVPILDTAFPARTVQVRRWLLRPIGDLRGIWFLSNDGLGSTIRRPGGPMRVRPRRAEAAEMEPPRW
jgi:transcriptional regulator with XRE-family HTH domain